jgi:mannosyltransferase PIG-V
VSERESPVTAADAPGLPWPGRALDGLAMVALALLVSIVVFGGFRLRLGETRVTAQDVWRPLSLLVVVAGLRHWLWPRPSWPARVAAAVGRAWRGPATRVVLPALVASRLMVLVVGFLGVVLIGYAPGAPPFRVSRNEMVNLPVRWDAGWYLGIALNGYDYDPNARATAQQNIAFFPAYPLAVRVATAWLGGRAVRPDEPISGNRVEWQYAIHRRALAAGLLLSIGAFGWGLVYLFRLARDLLDDDAAAGAVAIACAWPCAVFYSAFYTEGFFFLSVVGAWYELRRGRFAAAAAWGLLCGLSRPNGFLVSVPLALVALGDWRAVWRGEGHARRSAALGIAAAAAPGIGMLLFSAWLGWSVGRPFAWLEAHQAWGRVATDVAGLFTDRAELIAEQGFYTYTTNQPVELINATFVLAALALAVPITIRFGPAYGVFLLLMIVPPLLRGGFLSLGRLTSTLFPLFLYLGWQVRAAPRAALITAFAGLQALLAVLFFTWRPFF